MFAINRCVKRARSCAAMLLVFLGCTAVAEPRRVLIVHSFGRDFAPLDTMSSSFRTELARQCPEPLEFSEVSIETARFSQPADDRPLADYLRTLYAERRLDLIVTVAEPAMFFCLRHRDELFPETPLLAHVDHRQAAAVTAITNATIEPVYIKIPVLVENILRVLPATTNIVMVLGASPFERAWAEVCRQEFAPFTNRVAIAYLNDLPLDQMRARVAALPPNSAVLYAMLAVDAAGVPYMQEQALMSLRAAANAPLFGVFESQLGHGIVGGPLLPLEESGKQAARTALRLLRGEDPRGIAVPPPPDPVLHLYDWRELRRWDINPTRLPVGSEIRFRAPTFWEQYKWQLIGIHALCLVEGVLIFALLRNRRRLRGTQQELRQSEERLSLATNSANVGVWSWNFERDTIEATAECKQIFGFDAAESVSFNMFIERVHPEDREGVKRAVEEALASKSVYDTQYRIALPDGRIRWMAARGRGHFVDGPASEMLGVVIDISERKQAEEGVRRHRQELAHVSRISIMRELSASMAHELNQPLTAIMTNAQAAQRFLASGKADPDEFREILKDITSDTARARDVIRHLRALVKKSEPEFVRLDLGSIIEEVAGFLHGDVVARNVRITFDLAPELPPVHGDRIQLQQVMINLLLNAFDALNGNPVSQRAVAVSAAPESPGLVHVRVCDSGNGIPAGKLGEIFEPFFTTKREGMGMGLSVTRSIIELHGGRIWAENIPVGGAALHFTLPVMETS